MPFKGESPEIWLEEFERVQKEHLEFFKRCVKAPPEKIFLKEIYTCLYQRRKLQVQLKEALNLFPPEKISSLLPRVGELRKREQEIRDLVERLKSKFLSRMRKDPESELKRKALRDYLRYL